MPEFTKSTFAVMLKRAAANIEKEHENLSKLDAATGDGDHGITINRTMQAVVAALDENGDKSLADLMKTVAMKAMMCDGGSTSPLLGSYFMGLAKGAVSDELNSEQTADFFMAGLNNFYATSKAELGDKTMMDALRPATETLSEKLKTGASLADAFNAAAEAASEGMEKTKGYVAKFGRARTMGEKAIGHYDPGAVSISLIFQAFAEVIEE